MPPKQQAKIGKSREKSAPLNFYCSNEISTGLTQALQDLQMHRVETPKHSVWWMHPSDFRVDDDAAKSILKQSKQRNCRINFFPGVYACMKKCKLASIFHTWGVLLKLDKGYFDFLPEEYILPEELGMLRKVLAKNEVLEAPKLYIYKPDSGNSGKGIHIIPDLNALNLRPSLESSKAVVQEYITRPLLLDDGLKFDIRVYVYLESVQPLKAYVCREAMCRFCTVPYEYPDKRNMENGQMHLTNFGVNRTAYPGYVNDAFEDNHVTKQAGSIKRKLSDVLAQLADDGYNIEELWSKICRLISHSCATIQPHLNYIYSNVNGEKTENALNCFHLLGFDVLVSKDYVPEKSNGKSGSTKASLRPWLAEINANPSLKTDFKSVSDGFACTVTSRVDMDIKGKVLQGCLLLASKTDSNPPYFEEIVFDSRSIDLLRIGKMMHSVYDHLCSFNGHRNDIDVSTFHRFYSISRPVSMLEKLGGNPSGHKRMGITSAEIFAAAETVLAGSKQDKINFDDFCELFFRISSIYNKDVIEEVQRSLSYIQANISSIGNKHSGSNVSSLGHFLLLENQRVERLNMKVMEDAIEKDRARKREEKNEDAKLKWEAQQKVNKSIERKKKQFAMLKKEKHFVRLTFMKEKQRRQNEALAWLESHKKT